MERKKYIKPELIEIVPFPLMEGEMRVTSIGMEGHGYKEQEGTAPGTSDVGWGFGGSGGKDDDPDAKGYSWDDWDV